MDGQRVGYVRVSSFDQRSTHDRKSSFLQPLM
jgi:hypothetical protein